MVIVEHSSEQENDWLVSQFATWDELRAIHLWIGFTDEGNEGTFRWVNSEDVRYTNWNAGEPNNSGGIEHYAELLSSGIWNDHSAEQYPELGRLTLGVYYLALQPAMFLE